VVSTRHRNANIAVAWDLSARGPAWNDTATADARVHCAISVASTTIDVGWAGSILSAGVENAVEGVSDGYLNQLVGPLIAQGHPRTGRGNRRQSAAAWLGLPSPRRHTGQPDVLVLLSDRTVARSRPPTDEPPCAQRLTGPNGGPRP